MGCKKNISTAELFSRFYYKEIKSGEHSAEREVMWLKLLIFCDAKSFHSKAKNKVFTVFYLFEDDSLLGITYTDEKETRDILRVDSWESANDNKRKH